MTLQNTNLFIEKNLINGVWVDSHQGESFEVKNPATNEILGCVPNMAKEETQQAIDAANHAFQTWKHTTATERYHLLNQWYELVIAHSQDLATLMVLEQGKPLAEALAEVQYAAKFIQWFSEQAKRIHGSLMEGFAINKQLQYTKEPIGVVGIITPWNFPLAMITRKVAPALAAGCTVVVKPSDLTPYSALALAYLMEQAGIPKGVCNVITTQQASLVGQTLCKSKLVRKMSFTGSTRVGKILLEQSATTVKRMSLELGGNAPFIVFDDADLSVTLNALIATKFRNTGQTCVCANRIFVHENIHDEFVDLLQKAVEKFIVADGFTEGVNLGPLINDAALAKVQKHIQDSLNQGAKLITGGQSHEKEGTFFQPTILTHVSADSIFSCEETFGPVAPIISFSDEEQVIQQANQTDYGLSAYFCTQDFRRIPRVLKQLEAGMIGVNEGMISNEFGPFGGIKESGLGREGSILGIDEYLEPKYSVISFG